MFVLHLCLLLLQSNVSACSAKLALFYDWFFYNSGVESIMNIGKSHFASNQPFTLIVVVVSRAGYSRHVSFG